MAFQDVIDDYGNGQTGTITTVDGTVGYTITSGATTTTRPNTDSGAQVSADGSQTVAVAFDAPVIGVTLKFDRSNQPEIYKIMIDGFEVDIQDLIDSGDATFTTITAGTDPVQPGTHIIQGGGVTSTGAYDNNSLGFLTLNIPLSSIEVFGTGGTAGNWDLIEIGIDSESSSVVCFGPDTELETPHGPVRVADLTEGDKVVTLSGKIRTIRGTNKRTVHPIELFRETRLRPVRIAAGALGAGLPRRDLLVSRQHRILVASRIVRRVCGHDEVLIPACHLVGLPGITVAQAIETMHYHHILLECHDIVLANGAPTETLFIGPVSSCALDDALDEAAPEIRMNHACPVMAMEPARPFVTSKKARQIVAAHQRHRRPLLETALPIDA